jgi:hypothetical protein
MKTTEIEYFLDGKSLGLYEVKEGSEHLDRVLVAMHFGIEDFDKYILRPDTMHAVGAERVHREPGRLSGPEMIGEDHYRFGRGGFIEEWKFLDVNEIRKAQ